MKRLFAITLLLAAFSLQAQKTSFWQKVNNLLTIFPNIDTTYIYQPKQGFTLALFSTVQNVRFDTKTKFNLLYDNGIQRPCTSTYHLNEKPSTKIGLELGYGKFVLGYGFEIGPKRAYKKQTLGLNLLGKNWGLHFKYFNISNTFKSSIAIGNNGDINYEEAEIIATDPATLRYLFLDGYYVFNNKRFAYPAAYKAGLVQRKTAGSWMVTGRFMQGLLYTPPQVSDDSYYMLDGFSTLHIAIGGGYSANFVCWHRDPAALRDKGLRNLTINLTILPVLTTFNYLKTTAYEYNEYGNYMAKAVSRIYCYPIPNFIGSTAVSLTLDRFFISTQFVYNGFYFHSLQSAQPINLPISYEVENLILRGTIHNWNLKLLFTYKF